MLNPTLQKLYTCRYGFHGAFQICLLVVIAADGSYRVRKWRANSGRWTAGVEISQRDQCAKAGVNVSKL